MVKRLTILAVVAGILVGSAAFAVTVDDVGKTYNVASMVWDGTPSTYITIDGGPGSTYPARPDLYLSGIGHSSTNGWVQALCISPQVYAQNTLPYQLNKGWTTGEPGPGDTLVGGTSDNRGVANVVAWQRLTWMAYSTTDWGNAVVGSAGVSNRAAAMQLAAWELLKGDGSFNLYDGSFKLTSGTPLPDVITQAKTFWDVGMAANLNTWSSANGLWLSDHGQDFLVRYDIEAVPEIPAAVLGPLGLMALGTLKRRFAK